MSWNKGSADGLFARHQTVSNPMRAKPKSARLLLSKGQWVGPPPTGREAPVRVSNPVLVGHLLIPYGSGVPCLPSPEELVVILTNS